MILIEQRCGLTSGDFEKESEQNDRSRSFGQKCLWHLVWDSRRRIGQMKPPKFQHPLYRCNYPLPRTNLVLSVLFFPSTLIIPSPGLLSLFLSPSSGTLSILTLVSETSSDDVKSARANQLPPSSDVRGQLQAWPGMKQGDGEACPGV